MTATSSPLGSGVSHPVRSSLCPKGPRPPPLSTPRRPALHEESHGYDTPAPSVSAAPPQLRVIAASPVPPGSPRRFREPHRLGEHWSPSPLRRFALQNQMAGTSSPSTSAFRTHTSDPGHYAPLLKSLTFMATADEAVLVKIPRDDFYEVIDHILGAIFEEDRPAANALVFGDEDDEVDLEFRTVIQLQDVCIALAEEVVFVDGYLRLMTDESTF